MNRRAASAAWMRIARILYLLVLAVLLARVLFTNREQLADLIRVERPWLLGVALLTGFGQLALSASFWTRALAAMGQHVGWGTLLRVTARSIPARYVPGSVWYAASRVGMLRAAGAGMRALGVTALLESVLSVIVSMSVGAMLLGMAGRLPGERLTGIAWTLVLGLLVSPPVLNRVLAWITRRRGTPGGAPRLSWAHYRALVVWMVAFWLLSAATFTLYLQAFGLDLPGPEVISGTFLVAWVIGFLTPIAPQGAGAFEVAFVALLGGPHAGTLVVVVAGFRALIGIRDALAFGWGAWRGGVTPPVVNAPDGDPARPAPR
jgi:uncharacterized membrane protein YbhN (UPF0104 family)